MVISHARTAEKRARDYLEEAFRLRRERDEALDDVRRLQAEVERLQSHVARYEEAERKRRAKESKGRSEAQRLASRQKARLARYKRNRDKFEARLARGKRASEALRRREHWEWLRDDLVKLLRACATQDEIRAFRVTDRIVSLYAALRPRVTARFDIVGPPTL